ncbi:MAG: MgtC/SapB family protein [Chloroflexota bacterium]|nr:MgtC/SapB family protein [Chloroflexota bacterium]
MIDTAGQWAIIGRIALAAGLGASIGLEREYRGYPAGVRTMALVCMGAALFADESGLFGGDAARVAAQIVSGIGFLGAGLILREGGSVRGITTAATIWTTAAVGVAVGAHVYLVAVFAALFAVILLELRIVTKSIRPIGHETNGDPEDEAGHEHD